jgi:hypothetical protein
MTGMCYWRPSVRVLPVLAALLFLACKVYDPLYCDEDRECTDPDRPFCDLNGDYPASEGIGRTCIPDPTAGGDGGPDGPDGGGPGGPDASFCEAGAFVQCSDSDTAIYCNEQGSAYVTLECATDCKTDQQGCYCEPKTSSCSGDQTIHCGNDGQVQEIETCALGCNDTAERCVDVNPSNALANYLDLTDDAPVVVLSNGAIIDTDAGTVEDGDGTIVEIPRFQVFAPEGGVPIRLFTVKSLSIGDATVEGTLALAIVSDAGIEVRGHLRVLAGQVTTGTCVGALGECDGPPASPFGVCGGGGGGGFGSSAGDGGDGTAGSFSVGGGNGGASQGSATLVPLRGGCPGSGSGTVSPGNGGDGGGAIQLVSRTQILVEDGTAQAFINAGGRGMSGAAGGGAGGGILLEAPKVVVSSGAAVVANGGGGGSIGGGGENASLDVTAAEGGPAFPQLGAPGGDGGARSVAAADGDPISNPEMDNVYIGGSGGGGVGRIRVNVPSSRDFADSGTISPAPSVGTLATR